MKTSSLVFATLLLSAALAMPAQAAGDSVTYMYDGQGRLSTVTYANGTQITYHYDIAGNRTVVVTTCGSGGC